MKKKIKKQKAKFTPTIVLMRALVVCQQHMLLNKMSEDDKFIMNSLINEAVDRIRAFVHLTDKQRKQIKELEESLRKVAK